MPYDPDFISGFSVPLPGLGPRIAATAFNGGVPVDHTRFSIVFNQERGLLVYGAHNIDGSKMIPKGTIDRHGFTTDPSVPSHLQIKDKRGYRKNRWDRGHMVRRRSLHWGGVSTATTADRESSYWTNIAPQHEVLHDTAWGDIEDWMLGTASGQRACVFTGPVLTADDPLHKNGADQEPVRIPAGFWKVFVIENGNDLRAAAFLVWQRDFDQEEPVDFDPVLEQVRITTVEHLTGLSFSAVRAADPLHFGAVGAQRARRRVARTGLGPRTVGAPARLEGGPVTRAEHIVL